MSNRLLWEVQTLAANVTNEQLATIREMLAHMLGAEEARGIIAEWEHELEEND